jgi:DNA (cytosine-5)-methyltransferase 1
MRYGSVCSGIEAATAAWHGLGWKPSFFSEIEAFPRAVLAHHYPDVPLHGDFTTIAGDEYEPIDLLVGGTPCQSFSIAGLRGGLDDDRGNLALEFLRLAQRTRPKWLVWENVPGVLSSNGGRDFGSIIKGMVECGYGIAYRVLDAQYFGVAQRRRRVFVVGCLRDAASAAAVLFERHSLQGHTKQSISQRQGVGWVFPCLTRRGPGCLREEEGFIIAGNRVRHLTPIECERLQGFSDNYTAIPWRKKLITECPDGPRYKALGNSMAVPVMRWIGERIESVEKLPKELLT